MIVRKAIFRLLLCALLPGCQTAPLVSSTPTYTPPNPPTVKVFPESDAHPPKSFSDEYDTPIPVPGALNSAGAEDSPFMLPDGRTLFLFYTPDVRVPAEKQLLDGVTGIYVSKLVDGQWEKPQRVLLQYPGKLALDGCSFVLGDQMWFCSAREGYSGIHWFTAENSKGQWQHWKLADFPADYQVGELHISSGGDVLYFASERPGGAGGLDIWISRKVDGDWQAPINLVVINSEDNEGWPALSPDESELWFSRNDSIWRSTQINGEWQEPTQMFAPLAGEPTLDPAGNVYFVHHFFQDNQMIEADIYIAYRK